MAAYASALALRRAVELLALIPGASVASPPGAWTAVIASAALVILWVAVRRAARTAAIARAMRVSLSVPRPSRRASTMAIAAILCAAVLIGSALIAGSAARGSGVRLRALDVGQGDAFLIESAGRYALIDGGPDPALLLRRLGEALPPWQRRIDLIALTHEHADHGAGLLAVLDRYEVGLALEPVGMNDVPLVRFWTEHVAGAHVRRQAVAEGAVVRLGGVTFRVLAPGRGRRVDVPSLVLRMDDAAASVLFMGDAVDDAIADLLLSRDALAARVYVPPHHGADTPHASALVAAVHPETAVISVGANNRYGHPAPATLSALGALPVYRTDRYGTVEIELDGRPLVVRTTKTPLPSDRGGPVPSAAASR
jgi:competence protein ComEC